MQIGEGLTCTSCVSVISGSSTETTDEETLVAFWPKYGLRSDLRAPNFNLGEHPPSLFTLMHTQWPYQSKIAGASPAVYELQVRIGLYGSTVCNEPHQSRPR